MKRKTALLLGAFIVACGGDTANTPDAAADGGGDDVTVDNVVVDSPTSSDAGDAGPDGGAVAKWSRGYSPVTYGNGGFDPSFGVAVGVLASGAVDYGTGTPHSESMAIIGIAPATGAPVYGSWASSVTFAPTRVRLDDFSVTKGGSVQNPSAPIVSEDKTSTAESQAYFDGKNFAALLSGTNSSARVHAAGNQTYAVQALDSVTAKLLIGVYQNTINDYLQPGGFALARYTLPSYGVQAGLYRILPAPTTTTTVAVDYVLVPNATDIYIGGRMGGSFDFGNGLVNGSGLFAAKYKLSDLSLTWVKVFGATPLQDISLGPSDIPGVGMHLAWDGSALVIVTPYKGQIDFGDGQHQAPSNSHAVGFARLDSATGNALASASFAKGPLANGMPTRPNVAVLPSGNYALFDTVWDTIDVGGVTVKSVALADAFIATIDSTGKGLSQRVFSGAAEDLAIWMDAANDSTNDCFIVGRSTGSIDFGNGVLAPVSGSEVWVARVTP